MAEKWVERMVYELVSKKVYWMVVLLVVEKAAMMADWKAVQLENLWDL